MQRILAIAWLTLKAAVRYRLVIVLGILLLGGVVALPLVIEHDGTARGFAQIVLTYTLIMITALLGLTTLWLACGTLARDVEECQIQMVAVKPIARWEIWIGKLLGILTLDALLLALSAGAVFASMQFRAQRLPPAQQQVLRNEVLVARGSAKELVPDLEPEVDRILQERVKQGPISATDLEQVRNQIREQIKAQFQIVRPGYVRRWTIDFGLKRHLLQDRPLFLRLKFNVAQSTPSGTYLGQWIAGDLESPRAYRPEPMSLAADTFHEFELKPNLFDENGTLTVNYINLSDAALLFPLDEGLEILYRQGGFGLNFTRGVLIIFFWLTLLATLGLASASFLSFPVASFLAVSVLIVGLSSGTIAQIIEQGTVLEVNHDTGVADKPAWIDHIALPLFRLLLKIIRLVEGFSPIAALSGGRSITWTQLGLAFTQICLLMGGLFAAIGIWTFARRELATAQGNQ